MAKYTNDELLEAFGEMTLVELSEKAKKEDAEKAKAQLEEAGASVELK